MYTTMSKFHNTTTGKSLLNFATKTSLCREQDAHKLGMVWLKHVKFSPTIEYSQPIEDIYPEPSIPLYTRSISQTDSLVETAGEDSEDDIPIPELERCESAQPVIESIYTKDDTIISAYDREELFEGYSIPDIVVEEIVKECIDEIPVESIRPVPILSRANSVYSVLKNAQRLALRDRILGTSTTI